jgi:hypothetical protein
LQVLWVVIPGVEIWEENCDRGEPYNEARNNFPFSLEKKRRDMGPLKNIQSHFSIICIARVQDKDYPFAYVIV